MNTGVPMSTCVNSHSTCGINIRMQPCEAEYPIEAASGVPWMPTYGAERPIQRVPSGLPGPGGIGFEFAARAEPVGGSHHGLSHLLTISNWPSGVGYSLRRVATWNVRTSLTVEPTRYSRS